MTAPRDFAASHHPAGDGDGQSCPSNRLAQGASVANKPTVPTVFALPATRRRDRRGFNIYFLQSKGRKRPRGHPQTHAALAPGRQTRWTVMPTFPVCTVGNWRGISRALIGIIVSANVTLRNGIDHTASSLTNIIPGVLSRNCIYLPVQLSGHKRARCTASRRSRARKCSRWRVTPIDRCRTLRRL